MNKEPKEPQIVLSVKLTDDSFDSNIVMPIDVTPEQRSKFIQSWLAMMDSALAMTSKKDMK